VSSQDLAIWDDANEANPESTQSLLPLVVKSSATGPTGRERSRSAAGGAVPHDAGNDSFDPIAPAGEGNKSNDPTLS